MLQATFSKRLIALLACGALVLALCPAQALALTASRTGACPTKQVGAQEATVTVYVMEWKSRSPALPSATGDDYLTDNEFYRDTYTYKSNGLLSEKREHDDDWNVVTTYGYNRKNQVTSYSEVGESGTSFGYFRNSKTTVKRNGAGLPITRKVKYSDSSWKPRTTAYTVKSGKVRSSKTKRAGKVEEAATYSYKSGMPAKVKVKTYYVIDGKRKARTNTVKYTRDGHGNLARPYFKVMYDESGRPCGINQAGFGASFKEIRVPKALAPKVKAQQWALLNDNLNFVL